MRSLFLLLLLVATPVLAEKQVDYVNLGATLLKDGYVQRAKTVLEKADVSKQGFDFSRYYTLKGILLHKLGYPLLSNIFFDAAVKHGQQTPSIMLYVAKNYWQLQDYPAVVAALDKAGQAAKENPQMLVIKAEALKQQALFDSAWAVLDEGIALHPDYAKFYSQKFYYLLEMGYFQQAAEYAQKYLAKKQHSAKDFLAIAYALRESRQLDAAAALLEEAVILHRSDDKLIELLGQVYIDQENYLMAALVFDWASIHQPKFAYKAATLYLKAKQPIRSLQLNRRILKQDEKFRQRLGIDIYLNDYESLVTKTPALKRYGLLADDNIAYAIGYGYFRIGEFDKAKKYLKSINDSLLFSKASHVFQQIEKCRNEPLTCY